MAETERRDEEDEVGRLAEHEPERVMPSEEADEANDTIAAGNEATHAPPRGSPERGPGGVPRTTTTGDPEQDFRSVGDGAVEDVSEADDRS
jgi:hypothetical protein